LYESHTAFISQCRRHRHLRFNLRTAGGNSGEYVLGDSVTQFSLIIGIYLSAMGVGSWLSGFLDKNLAKHFVEIELAVAVLGGFSAPLLFFSFANVSYFNVILYGLGFRHRRFWSVGNSAADADFERTNSISKNSSPAFSRSITSARSSLRFCFRFFSCRN
jgi:hypothetical protein